MRGTLCYDALEGPFRDGVSSVTDLDINCPSCGRTADAADVNVAALVAKCTPCGKVFRFADLVGAPSPAPPQDRPLPPVPERITVVGTIDDSPLPTDYRSHGRRRIAPLVLRYRWFNSGAFFLLFFALAWNSFLLFWYSTAIVANGPWIMFVFPIAHVAVGSAVAKSALEGLLNRTTFALDGDRLEVKTGPIRWPWKQPVSVATADLRQLSVLETAGAKGSRTYSVIAHLADGTSRPLVQTLPDSHHAAYVERAIERHLGLVDDPWMNTTA